MMVLGFPVLRVSFGIWVPLQRGLVLVSCAQCFCLLYVSHLILSRVFYFLVSSSLHFWSLFFSHCCGHPLNLLLGGKTLWHLPYLLLVLVVVLVWYLVCCCASREHVPLVACMLAHVVGFDSVCALFYWCVSKFSVALSNICANFSKAWPCYPVVIVG